MKAPILGIVTLQRRSEFLRVRNGLRWATPSFVLEAKSRDGWEPPVAVPTQLARFGFTVTKKLGSAVHRNRIKRRLKSALLIAAQSHARPGFDYVVIARSPAETTDFAELVAAFSTAFDKAHSSHGKPPNRNRPQKAQNLPPT